MNHWLKASIEYANDRAYLDDLFRVYPIIENEIREVDKSIWEHIGKSFEDRDNLSLIRHLLKLPLFPVNMYRKLIMSSLVLRDFLYSL